MRGKVCGVLLDRGVSGITPAYAGKSAVLASRFFRVWDHPRLCGEKQSDKTLRRCLEGSPPPMRGKAQWLKDKVSGFGITPAYAGKRFAAETGGAADTDHPRLCGEK